MRYPALALICLVLPAASAATRPLEEVLEFEELAPRCVASTTVSDFGSGPVRIHAIGRRFGARTNVAVVVDTDRPQTESALATADRHNALFITRVAPLKPSGVEAEWIAGSVAEIDDDEIPGGVISFDFSELGPVTFYGLTLIDHDNHLARLRLHRQTGQGALLADVAADAQPYLTWGRKRFGPSRRRARLVPASADRPWLEIQIAPMRQAGNQLPVDVRLLRAAGREARSQLGPNEILPGGIPDVVKLEVELGGSSALDRIVFRRQLDVPPRSDDDLFSRIEERISESVREPLHELRRDFESAWWALVSSPPVLPEQLEQLVDELDRRLLGVDQPDGVRIRGLLECPDLPCGCPEVRALRAWVQDRLASLRATLPATAEPIASTPRAGPQLAAFNPGLYLAVPALSPQQAAAVEEVDCDGTFFEQFFCDGLGLLSGVGNAVASLLRPSIRFDPDSVMVAGVAQPCQEYRVAPLSAEYDHVSKGILPSESRRLPRGLYCVRCRTPDGQLRPFATLDLVSSRDAGPVKGGAERCVTGG